MHSLLDRTAACVRHTHANREIRLHFVHAGLDLMLFHGLPHGRRPVLVQFMRILNEEHLIRINLLFPIALIPNWDCIALVFFVEYSQAFFFCAAPGGVAVITSVITSFSMGPSSPAS